MSYSWEWVTILDWCGTLLFLCIVGISTILTFTVYKYFFLSMGCESSTIQSRRVEFNTEQDAEGKKRKWNTATRDEGQKDRRGGRESEGSSSRDDRGNRERREEEGEIVKRDIDDLLLALKPCCSCHRITQRQEHLLYPAAATWTWQGLSDILDNAP